MLGEPWSFHRAHAPHEDGLRGVWWWRLCFGGVLFVCLVVWVGPRRVVGVPISAWHIVQVTCVSLESSQVLWHVVQS